VPIGSVGRLTVAAALALTIASPVADAAVVATTSADVYAAEAGAAGRLLVAADLLPPAGRHEAIRIDLGTVQATLRATGGLYVLDRGGATFLQTYLDDINLVIELDGPGAVGFALNGGIATDALASLDGRITATIVTERGQVVVENALRSVAAAAGPTAFAGILVSSAIREIVLSISQVHLEAGQHPYITLTSLGVAQITTPLPASLPLMAAAMVALGLAGHRQPRR
jgi:hypothetical protein